MVNLLVGILAIVIGSVASVAHARCLDDGTPAFTGTFRVENKEAAKLVCNRPKDGPKVPVDTDACLLHLKPISVKPQVGKKISSNTQYVARGVPCKTSVGEDIKLTVQKLCCDVINEIVRCEQKNGVTVLREYFSQEQLACEFRAWLATHYEKQ